MAWQVLNRCINNKKPSSLLNKQLNNKLDVLEHDNYINNYGLLSWEFVGDIKLETIEFITNSYEKLIKYLKTALRDIYLPVINKSPFTHINILIFKVDGINKNLMTYDYITNNNYEYMGFRIDDHLLFFILQRKHGQLYTDIINSLPELYKLHDISYQLKKIFKKIFKDSLLKFIIKNKLNIDLETCKNLSKKELIDILKKYYYDQVWEKCILLE